jgi:hypothetical protein
LSEFAIELADADPVSSLNTRALEGRESRVVLGVCSGSRESTRTGTRVALGVRQEVTQPMPISARPVIKMQKVTIQVPEEIHGRVAAYAKYLGGTTDESYVYAEAVRHVITRDRGFAEASSKRA